MPVHIEFGQSLNSSQIRFPEVLLLVRFAYIYHLRLGLANECVFDNSEDDDHDTKEDKDHLRSANVFCFAAARALNIVLLARFKSNYRIAIFCVTREADFGLRSIEILWLHF